MNYLSLFLAAILLSGCTHYSVSNKDLSKPYQANNVKYSEYEEYPINIKADMHCDHSSRIIRCSNKHRLNYTIDVFKERGLILTPADKDENAPLLVLKERTFPDSLVGLSIFFNIFSLGLIPQYNYEKYIVTFKDPENLVEVSKEVKISYMTSWFHMFSDNSDDFKYHHKVDIEKNLISSVLNEANVKSVAFID